MKIKILSYAKPFVNLVEQSYCAMKKMKIKACTWRINDMSTEKDSLNTELIRLNVK